MKKRLLSILLTACLLMGLLPTVALAAEDDVNYLYCDENGANWQTGTKKAGEYTEITSSTYWELTTGWYVVNSNVTFNGNPVIHGDVHLILADNCTLSISQKIHLFSGNSLTIYAQSTDEGTMGKLNAGVFHDAAIGGYGNYGCGTLTINGGKITATSILGAGIGGGELGGDGGIVTINGGIVKASSMAGAGIGGGCHGGNGGTVTINGGNVTASSESGAGIGSGGNSYGNGADVTITGGTVTAITGNDEIAAIGCRFDSPGSVSPGTLIITGGNITPPERYYRYPESAGIKPEGDSNLVAFGNLTLPVDLTIPEGKTLTIPSGASLTIPEGKTLTIPEGVTLTIAKGGALTNNGTIINFGTITGEGTFTGNTPKTVAAKYLDENGEVQTAFCDAAITDSNKLADLGEADKTTWYVVQGDVAFGMEETYQRVNTKGDVHLILADGCTLTLAEGLTASGDLTVYAQSTGDGQGSMSAYETSATFFSCGIAINGNFTINGGIIDAKSVNASRNSYGISAYNMTVNGGSVTATSIGADSSAGIYVEVDGDDSGTMTISGGSVTATGGLTVYNSYGIAAAKELIIEGGTVKAGGGDTPEVDGVTLTNRSIGIYSPEVTIDGGTVEATGGSVDAGSYGILAVSELSITGGSVEAKGGDADGESYGILAGDITGGTADIGSVTITANAEVTAAGGKAGYGSYGIYALIQLAIEGGTVEAEGGKAEDSYGICANNVTVNGSTVKAEGGEAENSSTGISARNVSIKGSTVKTESGEAGNNSYGIIVLQKVTITGGSVEVKAGTAKKNSSNGIVALGGVTITAGSHVTVQTSGNGTNGHAMNKSPQLPATYWWRTADTDPFTASDTEPYVHYHNGDDYVEFTDSFTITLDPNFDGGESGTMTTGTDGKLLEALPTPTGDGYTFDGWFTAATGGEKVTNETVFNGYVTIYAHWTAKSSGGGSGGVSTYGITVESAGNGAVTITPKTASRGATVTLTVEPDKGYTLETLTVTDRNGNEIELTAKGDGKFTFKMPGSKVTVKATFMEDNSMLNFFVDVPADAYYYDAVLWAAENGITGGVDDTHFAPNAPCTRAQIVTFLWRAAGCPEPESLTSLSDVPADAYYAKAVAWALENGITTGTGDGTTFSPNATCTRAQAMTFIYRSEQARGGGMQGAWMFLNPFADVNLESYYGEAVMWAVANGVTDGTTATTFSPNATCTRAQIVTFLYRNAK